MSYLHRKPMAADSCGVIQHITPQNAHWEYVGFDVVLLKPGQSAKFASGHSTELCAVLLSGRADLATLEQRFTSVGARTSVFAALPPYALYLPPGETLTVTALTELELALCRAPAQGGLPVRLITPDDCVQETRGQGTNTRQVCNILFANLPAERLLITEVITPAGHWSSYPPHKHDRDARHFLSGNILRGCGGAKPPLTPPEMTPRPA